MTEDHELDATVRWVRPFGSDIEGKWDCARCGRNHPTSDSYIVGHASTSGEESTQVTKVCRACAAKLQNGGSTRARRVR